MRVTYSCLLIIVLTVTQGCQIIGLPVVTAMHLANVADQASLRKRGKKIWDQHRENVRELRAKGDPMGDYLYALGNAQGWIGDTSDPERIVDLFIDAINNGSNDAKLVLGILYFRGFIPGQDSRPSPLSLPAHMRNHESGIRLIRDGIKTRCSYAEPTANRERGAYIRHVSAASRVWHVYRDGKHTQDKNGAYYLVVAKDKVLEEEWFNIDKQCKASGSTSS